MRVYFGHPMNTYGTPLETSLLAAIAQEFPGFVIENPNQERHQEACRKREAEGGDPMEYFFEEVLPNCQAGVFLPFRDGKWGAGCFKEATALLDGECTIWTVAPNGKVARVTVLDGELELSIEETLSRIRAENGEWLPY